MEKTIKINFTDLKSVLLLKEIKFRKQISSKDDPFTDEDEKEMVGEMKKVKSIEQLVTFFDQRGYDNEEILWRIFKQIIKF